MTEKLDINLIGQALNKSCNVRLFESIGSTNEWLIQKTREAATLPLACFAEQQTQGRGRRGKHWVSPAGCNIYMSLAWRFDVSISQLGVLSLAMGLAVVKTLEHLGVNAAMLKWPNDVLVNDKKIAGVLIEAASADDVQSTMVIGIGLNYHLPAPLPESHGQPWTDIVSSLNATPEGGRNRLAVLLLRECMAMCERIPQESENLISEFHNHYDACAHNMVNVILETGEQLQGIACGVTSTGELRVLIDGEERAFNSADISLRKSVQNITSEKAGIC